MENLWLIVTLGMTIILTAITFYYSYKAKKELEKKVGDAKTNWQCRLVHWWSCGLWTTRE